MACTNGIFNTLLMKRRGALIITSRSARPTGCASTLSRTAALLVSSRPKELLAEHIVVQHCAHQLQGHLRRGQRVVAVKLQQPRVGCAVAQLLCTRFLCSVKSAVTMQTWTAALDHALLGRHHGGTQKPIAIQEERCCIRQGSQALCS